MQRNFYLLVILVVLIISCEKDQFTGKVQPDGRNLVISSGETGAGITYHNISPDWEKHGFGLYNDSLNIDINGDGIFDVSIKYTTFLTGSEYDQQTSVRSLNGAAISLAPKNSGDEIGFSSGWTTSASLLGFTKINFATPDTAQTGLWIGASDKYLGVRIIKNSRPTFGWIRMSLLVPPVIIYIQQIIVKDYGWKAV